MKWIRENYKGEKVVWYSGDVIETIKGIANNFQEDCKGKICNCLCCAILEYIESLDE